MRVTKGRLNWCVLIIALGCGWPVHAASPEPALAVAAQVAVVGVIDRVDLARGVISIDAEEHRLSEGFRVLEDGEEIAPQMLRVGMPVVLEEHHGEIKVVRIVRGRG